MSTPTLVLSIFPGIDLLGAAFEQEGYCVVRGPDVLWGGDVRTFHPPPHVFDGIIGGPPCQTFSALARLVRAQGREPRHGNLIPEFERVVAEAQPSWFLMENVPHAPLPVVDGYIVHAILYNNRWTGAEQNRLRRLSFGSRDGRRLYPEVVALEAPLRFVAVVSDLRRTPVAMANGKRKRTLLAPPTVTGQPGPGARDYYREDVLESPPVTCDTGGYTTETARQVRAAACVTSSDGGRSVRQVRYTLADACTLQGLPPDFLADAPFTAAGKLQAVANGVPLSMGRAIARAVWRAQCPDMP